eukprot:CAMPEP_0182919446 /NCGR_PEP_ID=MMETSP0105_2-20130417/2728_1 /TAXON_ID=81532 ORGANISM="Acanthoeca-like sp., Strain 10tr" /NCGR_SAMPLE_ID=MMETSP0105_2 /ASSEMBLY_ACC=CAM_ASM_000205 /LENGTH=197 /DNA_ID=CAMNT_0025056635 /DNA_START=65 /DNA_END=658 /DNA_ORIENTATION=-
MSGLEKELARISVTGTAREGRAAAAGAGKGGEHASASSTDSLSVDQEWRESSEAIARRKSSGRSSGSKQAVTARWLRKEKIILPKQKNPAWTGMSLQFRLTSTKELEIMVTSDADKDKARLSLETIQEAAAAGSGVLSLVGLDFSAAALAEFFETKFMQQGRSPLSRRKMGGTSISAEGSKQHLSQGPIRRQNSKSA